MWAFGDDSCLFVTYNKANPLDERNYVDGKPDYADTFIDESVFEWESQVGRGIDSSYMEEIRNAKNIRLFVKKSDAETNFYYMGKVDIINMEESQKKDNNNNDRKVTKVKFLLNKPVEKELLDYLSNYWLSTASFTYTHVSRQQGF